MVERSLEEDFTVIDSQMGSCFVHVDFIEGFQQTNLKTFEDWMALEVIPFREVSMRPNRPVVEIEIKGFPKSFYLKRNLDNPRPEGFLQKGGLSQPESESRKEVDKILGYWAAGIPTQRVVAWGEGQWNGTPMASFVVTEDLDGVPLERYLFHNWKGPLDETRAEDKRATIQSLARLSRRMHDAGWVHRDFYLGHIFVREGQGQENQLSVIDVQRATRRPSWWIRSQVKDLASLHFSADPEYIDDQDRLLFLKTYWATERFSVWQRFLLKWIGRKCDRIRRHTEKALGIPYKDFFKNKYY